jgi:uncharacterized membrane protein
MNSENTEKDIVSLEQERERYITKLFWFALEIAIIFLVPALLAVFISLEFFSKKVAIISLPFTFVLSWIIIFIRWKKINNILTKIDKDILELKKNKNAGNN